jgi:hypothetical protein
LVADTSWQFDLHVSELVVFEAGKGDAAAAQARLDLIQGLPVLQINAAARSLAESIFRSTTLPDKATADALHIALAAVNGMDSCLPGTARTSQMAWC